MTRDNVCALVVAAIVFGPVLVLFPWLLTGSAAMTGVVLMAGLAVALWALVD